MAKSNSALTVVACMALFGLVAAPFVFAVAWVCRELGVSDLVTLVVLVMACRLMAPLTRAYLNWVNRVIGSSDRV